VSLANLGSGIFFLKKSRHGILEWLPRICMAHLGLVVLLQGHSIAEAEGLGQPAVHVEKVEQL